MTHGISIHAYTSLLSGADYLGNVTKDASNYTHTIAALGGYDSMSFTYTGTLPEVEDWFVKGLGRHIVVYDDGLQVCWEGFVNRMTLSAGSLSITRGPLLDISNRVALVYSTVNATVTPPIVGERATTAYASDTDSQEQWGILETILSGGGMTATTAAQVRDTYLAENKDPVSSQTVNLDQGAAASIKIECSGYYRWFDAYYFSDTATTGTVNLTVKMASIIADNPNIAWLAFGTDNITANTLQVAGYEDNDVGAWGLLKGLVAHGDTADNRYTFGVYAGQEIYYAAAPTDIAYTQRIADPNQRVFSAGGVEVPGYNVLPARWLFLSDFLSGQILSSDYRTDPRYVFIEKVTFSEPNKLTITGGRVEELPQKLAKFGLSGIGG